MKEVIVPYAWHSFCISIDLVQNVIKLYHNDHIQFVQPFAITHSDKDGLHNLMSHGYLGGPKFVGYVTDFQIFAKVLHKDDIYEWTACNAKVIYTGCPKKNCDKISLHIFTNNFLSLGSCAIFYMSLKR